MAGLKGAKLAKQAEEERRLAAEKKKADEEKEEAQAEAPKVEKADSDETEIVVTPATTAEAKLIAAEQAEEERLLAAKKKKANEEKAEKDDIAALIAAIEKKLGKHPEFFLTNSEAALKLTSEQCEEFRNDLVAEMKPKTGAGGKALNELIGWFDGRIGALVAEAEKHKRGNARTHVSPVNGVPAVIVNGSAPTEAQSDAPARADEPTDKVNVSPVNVKTGAEGTPAASERGRKDVRGLSGSLMMKRGHPVSRREIVGCVLILILFAGLIGTNVGHWFLGSVETGISRPIARTEEREQPRPSREAGSASQPTAPAAPRPAPTPTTPAPVCHPAREMAVCGGTRQLAPSGHWHCGGGTTPIFVGGQLDHCASAGCEYCD